MTTFVTVMFWFYAVCATIFTIDSMFVKKAAPAKELFQILYTSAIAVWAALLLWGN